MAENEEVKVAEAVQTEINDFVSDVPLEAPPAEQLAEPPVADPPKEEPPKEEPPVVEPPKEESQKVEPPKEEPPKETPPPAEVPPVRSKEQELEEALQSARTQIEELSSRIVTKDVPPPPAADASPVKPVEPEVIQFVADDKAFDDVLRTPANFNKFMTGVVYKGVETVFRAIPKMVVNLADQQITTRTAVSEFYQENKDLIPNKAFVGVVADDLSSKHPDWKLDKLMGELGKEVRSRLKMVTAGNMKPSTDRSLPPSSGGKPAFAGAGGSANRGGSGGQLSDLQKDINDLISE